MYVFRVGRKARLALGPGVKPSLLLFCPPNGTKAVHTLKQGFGLLFGLLFGPWKLLRGHLPGSPSVFLLFIVYVPSFWVS